MGNDRIPGEILKACCTILAPYCPGLTPNTLARVLRSKVAGTLDAPPLITKHEAARILSVSPWTITRMGRDGRIRARLIGSHWRYDAGDVLALACFDDGAET